MPDLQTELSKVITQWSEPGVQPDTKPQKFLPTVGTSRAVSDYIRTNPGVQYGALVQALVAANHSRPTVYALVNQMKRQGLVVDNGGALTATYTEYTPLKSYTSWKNAQLKAAKPKRKYTRRNAAAKAAAYEAHENYNPTAQPQVVAPPEFNAEEFVNGLTLKQAKAVYGELKKVFE